MMMFMETAAQADRRAYSDLARDLARLNAGLDAVAPVLAELKGRFLAATTHTGKMDIEKFHAGWRAAAELRDQLFPLADQFQEDTLKAARLRVVMRGLRHRMEREMEMRGPMPPSI